MDNRMWGEMLDVLKDIGTYLAKQDAEQKKADVQSPPKTGDDQKPISGGDMPGDFGPGKGFAKNLRKQDNFTPEESQENESEAIDSDEGSLLKQDEDIEELPLEDEEELEEEAPVEEGPIDEDVEELKSLLKDIKSTIMKQENDDEDEEEDREEKIVKSISSKLEKSLPRLIQTETHKMMRKMGFTPSRPDIVRLGVDEFTDIKKSASSEDESKKFEKVGKLIDSQSRKSWAALGREREALGGFNAFSKKLYIKILKKGGEI